MNKKLEHFDSRVIRFFREYGDEIGRVALFIIFFWFGILKVLMLSPAGPLVVALSEETFLRAFDPWLFTQVFGFFEMIIGIMVLIPKLERITFALLLFHLFTTIMPLYLLPSATWTAVFVPTLVGQYIIKNAALLSLGMLLFARLKPMSVTHSVWGQEED